MSMRQAILLGFLAAFLVFAGCVKNASAQSVKNWKLCSEIQDFPVKIVAGIVLQAGVQPCVEMDDLFFLKLYTTGLRTKQLSAVKDWLIKRVKLPHEHEYMFRVESTERTVFFNACGMMQ